MAYSGTSFWFVTLSVLTTWHTGDWEESLKQKHHQFKAFFTTILKLQGLFVTPKFWGQEGPFCPIYDLSLIPKKQFERQQVFSRILYQIQIKQEINTMQYNIYSRSPAIILKPRNPLFTKPSPSHSSCSQIQSTQIICFIYTTSKTNMQIYPILFCIPLRKPVPPNLLNKILSVASFE